MQFLFILVLIICIVVSLFAIQNGYPVDVDLFFTQFTQVSQSVVILLSAAFGAIIAVLFGLVRSLKKGSEFRKFKKETKTKQAEIEAELKTLKDASDLKDEELAKITEQKETIEKDRLTILDARNDLLEENRVLIKEKMDLETKLSSDEPAPDETTVNLLEENIHEDDTELL